MWLILSSALRESKELVKLSNKELVKVSNKELVKVSKEKSRWGKGKRKGWRKSWKGKMLCDYKGGSWKKLKKGKMRATRIIETLSRIAVVERVKLRQLLRLSRRHSPTVCGGWWVS